MLREQPDAAHPGALLNAATEPFSLAVRPDPYGNTVAFQLKGALSSNAFTIRIYGLNGRVMDVLSGLVHSGSAMAVWRGPALSNGLLFATVRSGRNAKTVKFVLFK
jgi:hypothetical protein